MKKCTILSLVSVAVMLFAPAAFAQGVVNGSANSYHVIGEKLDSGLGTLTATDLRVYMRTSHVAGEKLDSGLGELTAADVAVYADPYHVAGEKRDSGLGELTVHEAPANTAVTRASY